VIALDWLVWRSRLRLSLPTDLPFGGCHYKYDIGVAECGRGAQVREIRRGVVEDEVVLLICFCQFPAAIFELRELVSWSSQS